MYCRLCFYGAIFKSCYKPQIKRFNINRTNFGNDTIVYDSSFQFPVSPLLHLIFPLRYIINT